MPDDSMPIFDEGPGQGGSGDGKTDAPAEPIPIPGLIPDDLPAGPAADAFRALQQLAAAERERADRAESAAADLRARLADLERALAESNESVAAVERRHQIDLLLIEQEALDLEAARILTEVAVTQMRDPDITAAVSDLRRRKPFLFRRRAASAGAAMSAAALGPDPLEQAATDAARTGDRASLLRYLRARRGA